MIGIPVWVLTFAMWGHMVAIPGILDEGQCQKLAKDLAQKYEMSSLPKQLALHITKEFTNIMTESKEECDKAAKENWHLAHKWDKLGKSAEATEARLRAIDWEKARDSWWYRTFGW